MDINELTDLIDMLSEPSVSELAKLLLHAGPLRVRALVLAGNLNEAVTGERLPKV